MASDNGTPKEKVGVIFDACDVYRRGHLDSSELKYALQALGLYPKGPDIEKIVKELKLEFPLKKQAFEEIVGSMETSECARGLPAVPYALRGTSLKQLKAVQAGLC